MSSQSGHISFSFEQALVEESRMEGIVEKNVWQRKVPRCNEPLYNEDPGITNPYITKTPV